MNIEDIRKASMLLCGDLDMFTTVYDLTPGDASAALCTAFVSWHSSIALESGCKTNEEVLSFLRGGCKVMLKNASGIDFVGHMKKAEDITAEPRTNVRGTGADERDRGEVV